MSTELEPITRADDRTITVTLTDLAGQPFDWTGSKLWFTAKRLVGDSDANAVIQKTSDPGGGITFPAAGTAKIEIDSADTASLPNSKVTRLFWDVQILTADGKKHTVDSGRMSVGTEITIATS